MELILFTLQVENIRSRRRLEIEKQHSNSTQNIKRKTEKIVKNNYKKYLYKRFSWKDFLG